MNKDPFKEYIKQTEPDKRDKGYAWQTAIGLQVVDGLKPSKYLIDTAKKILKATFPLMKRRNFIIVLCISVECLKKWTLKVQKWTLRT